MNNLKDQEIRSLECALLNHYKTDKPGIYRTEIKVSEARKLLKNIVGIRRMNSISDLDITDVILDIEDNNIASGRLQYLEHINSYRTA
jgi:hypothetical protein